MYKSNLFAIKALSVAFTGVVVIATCQNINYQKVMQQQKVEIQAMQKENAELNWDNLQLRHNLIVKSVALQNKEEELAFNEMYTKDLQRKVRTKRYSFTEEEIDLLARCAQAEAGDYEVAKDAQKAVVQVILNRLESDEFPPTTIKGIIYQPKQFSVTKNGMINNKATAETRRNVEEVLLYGTDIPSDVLYFYADWLDNGDWVTTRKTYKEIDGTVFCYNRKK